jgi:hypothetical protein
VVAFAIAFAWVESAVVVYLRKIFFAGSFSFPLATVWENGCIVLDDISRIEIAREAATLIMLGTVGALAGQNALQRFCFFMIALGIWDLFYYVWLWVMPGWPENFMTWDILFSIPLPWVGPVIAPVLVASAMAGVGSSFIYCEGKSYVIHWRWYDWLVESTCGFLLMVAFCFDWKNILRVPDGAARSGIPNPFAWLLFLPVLLFAILYAVVRLRQSVTGRPVSKARETL